jgi:hypothetical protein
MLAAGTIRETGEIGENAVVEQIEFLTGLTGLFPLSPVPPKVGLRRAFPLPAHRPPLLIHPAREKPTVHGEQMPGDKARRLGREKNRRTRHLVRLSEAAHRRAHQ